MKKLPGPYDNGPEYEGFISRFIKRFRAKRELNKRAIARRKEIETALRDCRLGLCTPNQAREKFGLEPVKDSYDFITAHTPSSQK